ncbi:MAG: Coenzyme F420 hydrogenase/dehydrogenase, beta subunit C-terminal domain [Pseudomonadota bacterium]
MVDVDHVGLRPKLSENADPAEVTRLHAICPTVSTDFGVLKRRPDYTCAVDEKTERDWGAITGVWEGYATDEDIRFKASSGGALTALALYCLEARGLHGVLHTGENPADPIRNATRLSRTRADLMAALGSRYSPAAICEGLGEVERAPGPCVVIGKPVEIAGTRNAMTARPALAEKVGVTLSFFCAETPPTLATRKLLHRCKVSDRSLASLRYRGYGWPGFFSTRTGADTATEHLIYYDAWAFLQRFRPWSTHLWPDGSGELADVSCGDPWYEMPDGENPGSSLIVARTRLGKEIVEAAMASGYLTAQQAEPWKIEASQSALLQKKGSVWGRRLIHSLMGLPTTKFRDLELFEPWRVLPLRLKMQSTLGTLRRIFKRRLWRRK